MHIYKFLHEWLILLEHLVVALGYRTGDDERSTGIVDKHGVNLIDNGIVVGTLHEVVGRVGHIVAQVVKTEFIVSTECDVGLISHTALVGVRLMLVDTVNR